MNLFALWYHHSPEGRQIIAAWEQRALFAGAGMLVGYVLFRLRSPRREPLRLATLRLIVGGIVATGLWFGIDLLRGESFLGELWAALPSREENVLRALVLVVGGWAGWSIAVSEVFRRLVVNGRQGPAEVAAASDGTSGGSTEILANSESLQ